MKRMISASRASMGAAARKVLQDLRQLDADLDNLDMVDSDALATFDLETLADDVKDALRYVAHIIEGD